MALMNGPDTVETKKPQEGTGYNCTAERCSPAEALLSQMSRNRGYLISTTFRMATVPSSA